MGNADKNTENGIGKYGVRALAYLVVTLSLYLFIWQIAILFFSLPVYYYARLIEFLALCLFVALALSIPMEFGKMGIVTTRRTLFRSLALGGGVGLAAVALFAALGAWRGASPFFSWQLAGDFSRVTYFVVAPFQEVLAKSVMLYTFELSFDFAHPRLANLLAALVFGTFHVVYGVKMMCLAMLLSLVTGLIFRRERCVWGCAIAHFAFGFFPLCFGLS